MKKSVTKGSVFMQSILICIGFSFLCFMLFDYPELRAPALFGRFTYLVVTVISTVVQITGCSFLGFYSALKHKESDSVPQENRSLLVSIIQKLLLIAVAVYLLTPEIRWRTSDLVLYTGIKYQDEMNLYTSSIFRQFVILRLISYEAVVAFLSYAIAYSLCRRKEFYRIKKKVPAILSLLFFLSCFVFGG